MSDDDDEKLALARRIAKPLSAKDMVLPMLASAVAKNDSHLEGRVLAFLAELDNLLDNYVAAYEQASRAVHLLQAVGDHSEEAGALAVLAVASSRLGRNDEAIESALLGVEVAKFSADVERQASALAQLGLVLFHAKCFDAAKRATREARGLSSAGASALTMLSSLVVEGCCETLRVVFERHETGYLPSLDEISALLCEYQDFAACHDMEALAQPDQQPLQDTWKLVSSAANCWLGKVSRAQADLESFEQGTSELGTVPWLESLKALVRCELALAREDWHQAELHAQGMVDLANQSGQQQAALLGHVLACRALQCQGKHEQALVELKELAARERRIRSETLPSRSAVVAWHLEMRRSEQMRRELQTSAARFEQLAMVDPLTGIANRRCFENISEQGIRESRATGDQACVALIDVDAFKQINDSYGHLVGDKVLQAIAALLTQHVRANDLAARLAGDEFVLLLQRTDLAHATEVCERVRSAVESHDWSGIAAGLTVSISLGIAQSRPGDSLDELLARSDLAMYEHKASRMQAVCR